MMNPAIECAKLTKSLPSGDTILTILDGVDLRVEPGEWVAIQGPSGSGKSTLLGLLAGFDRPTSGSVKIDGAALETMSEDELALLRRRKLGFVFQSFHLLANLTARENVLFPLELAGIADAKRRADEVLHAVGLGARGHHYPAQLSGGEQQRVAIARAFAAQPAILLADEPTGSLDAATGAMVLDMLIDLRVREKTTLILITHDDQIARRAPRRVKLAAGKIIADESTAETAS